MSRSINRFSLPLWLLTCAIVLGTFLPAMLVERPNFVAPERNQLTVFVKYWEVAFGSEVPSQGAWTPFDNEVKSSLAGYKGTVWLRRDMPDINWHSPYLFFSGMTQFEVQIGEKIAYSFNSESMKRLSFRNVLHPVAINQSDEGKSILIRSEWEGQPFIGSDLIIAGEPDQVLYAIMQAEIGYLLFAALYLAAGVVALAMFIRRRIRLYGWFMLMAFMVGLSLFFSCRLLQWFVDVSAIYYWKEILMPVAAFAFFGFYGEALGMAGKPLIRAGSWLSILLFVAALIAGVWEPSLYWKMMTEYMVVVAVIGVLIISYALFRYPRQPERRGERIWLLRGFWVLAICFVSALSFAMFPVEVNSWQRINRYLFRVVEGLMANGLLLFMVSMAMVIVSSVRRLHAESDLNAAQLVEKNKELEQFHRNLEQLVETRTSELAQANRRLSVTMREKAESLAEISVLEERSRIAYEMHDVVGHTLTAAIVQLEATKTVAVREGAIPEEKLDLLSGLVRKGLDDIRRTVRLLKAEEPPTLTLEESLRELIQYAEDTMEVRIYADLTLSPELPLGKLAEHSICHALQEGLTNGIKHGRCSRFWFSVHLSGETLRFRLINDGEPFDTDSSRGFGLTSMEERFELLGGSVTIKAAEGENGSPMGCLLTIELPLLAPSQP